MWKVFMSNNSPRDDSMLFSNPLIAMCRVCTVEEEYLSEDVNQGGNAAQRIGAGDDVDGSGVEQAVLQALCHAADNAHAVQPGAARPITSATQTC
jgi:hypothetical protein